MTFGNLIWHEPEEVLSSTCSQVLLLDEEEEHENTKAEITNKQEN